MSELPSGWTHFSLKDIGGLTGGKTPSKANPVFWSSPDIPWISPKDMKKPLLETSEDKISKIALEDAGMTLYPKDSVLMVTRSGILQHTFPVALVGAQVTVNQDIKVLQPKQGISPKFSFYMLKNYGSKILSECSKAGTTVQSVDSEKLEAFSFPLPPLTEQIRITQKLDEILAQVDTLKACIDAIPKLLIRFRQSVLAAAISGRLTDKWRNEKQRSPLQNWRQVKVGDLCKLKSGIAISTDYEKDAGEFKYFKVGEMNSEGNEQFLQYTNRFLSKGDAPEKSLMPRGSILFPKRGGAIATNKKRILKEPSFVDLNIMGIIVPEGVETMYIYRWFETIDLAKLNTGSTIPQVNNTDIAPLEVPLPPQEEQTEIVHRVEQLFAFADQLDAKVASAQSRIDLLTQSILAKAFRGELVPQNPNDEPASVLLERIKAQRSTAPKAKRGRKIATSDDSR